MNSRHIGTSCSSVMPQTCSSTRIWVARRGWFARYVPSAVKDLVKEDLELTDSQTSYPTTAFVIVYLLASPIFSALADRFSRVRLIAVGVLLWSAATAGAALATDFWGLMIARSLVGIGEAAYATLSPSILSDHYPPSRRNRILTYFYMAIPIGAALGFVSSSALARIAFAPLVHASAHSAAFGCAASALVPVLVPGCAHASTCVHAAFRCMAHCCISLCAARWQEDTSARSSVGARRFSRAGFRASRWPPPHGASPIRLAARLTR